MRKFLFSTPSVHNGAAEFDNTCIHALLIYSRSFLSLNIVMGRGGANVKKDNRNEIEN